METAQVVDAGCDWLTLTDKESSGILQDLFLRNNSAAELEYWQWLMYKGHSREQRYYGKSYQGELVQLRGYAAKEDYELYAHTGTNVSRCDWQVTYKLEIRNEEHIRQLRDRCIAERAKANGKWKITFIDGCGQGDTLYIGSRSSEAFIRIYDKGAQSGEQEPGWTIRCEVELKGGKAQASVANQLSGGMKQVEYALNVVNAFLLSKGLLPLWSSTSLVALPKGKYVPDDVKRKLKWLSKSVAPALAELKRLGYGSEAYSMLGIALTPNERQDIL